MDLDYSKKVTLDPSSKGEAMENRAYQKEFAG